MEKEELKHCPKCDTFKARSEFFNSSTRKDGKQGLCKACQKTYKGEARRKWEREYYARNPEKAFFVRRKAFLKRMYGITLEDYEKMSLAQNGTCAICGNSQNGHPSQKYLCIDHDHKTGKIRGLLCSTCNKILGQWNDDPEKFTKAIEYLKKNGA